MDSSVPVSAPSNVEQANLRRLAANVVRGLSMDGVQKANSGHPGMPMGMADAAVVLWTSGLCFDPADPAWPNRDRFVLSAGHGSMLLYSLLHLTGFDLSLEDLKSFRQWQSRTPGHPEHGHTPGVETTTGPLGQGLSNAVGMALAERCLAARFNRPGLTLVDHYTYVIAGDGDLMEGITHEASSLAGHLGLGKLIVLYDDNGISIDGPTSLTFSEDVVKRYEAYGWHVQRVDGHDSAAVQSALDSARNDSSRPSLIACRTHIGFGSPNRQDTSKAHGEPLGEDEVRRAKEALGLPVDTSFHVPEDVRSFFRAAAAAGAERRSVWLDTERHYARQHPDTHAEWVRTQRGELPEGWATNLPSFPADKPMATRAASGAVLNAIVGMLPELLGGSADLTPSNNTLTKSARDIARNDCSGHYVRYGVREHAMAAAMSGMALHGGLRPYGGTFLVFSDYMRPAVRLAAMMEAPVIYVFTHDSIGLGEDGPTHQPIEHLASLRAIPNLLVFRPADAHETAVGWRLAVERTQGPTALVLTRQAVPVLDAERCRDAGRGAYVLWESGSPRVVLIGSGSEVHIALEAGRRLAAEGIGVRVVSMPSPSLFEQQPAEYREQVLPPALDARVAIEAGVSFGWDRYVGGRGRFIGLDHFGASAPYQALYTGFNLTPEAVATAARTLLG
ncbi:MAG: transketolase [Vicinamibacterales bacterium]